jgi:hypothetical protein
MATFHKFNSFVEALASEKHNFASDTIKVVLTNTEPSASNTVLANITQIANGSGYTTGGATATVVSAAQTAGVYKLVLSDVTWIAWGGPLGPFRYVVVYNDSAPSDELIGWYDHGESVTLPNGDPFVTDFNASSGFLTIT